MHYKMHITRYRALMLHTLLPIVSYPSNSMLTMPPTNKYTTYCSHTRPSLNALIEDIQTYKTVNKIENLIENNLLDSVEQLV